MSGHVKPDDDEDQPDPKRCPDCYHRLGTATLLIHQLGACPGPVGKPPPKPPRKRDPKSGHLDRTLG